MERVEAKRKGTHMLGILADSFMTATRSTGLWMRDIRHEVRDLVAAMRALLARAISSILCIPML